MDGIEQINKGPPSVKANPSVFLFFVNRCKDFFRKEGIL